MWRGKGKKKPADTAVSRRCELWGQRYTPYVTRYERVFTVSYARNSGNKHSVERRASGNDIQNNIDNVSVDILGPRRGITTYSNGRLKFYTTAVVAVLAWRWLDAIIGAVEITEDICDADGKVIFSGLKGNYERQTQLVKSVLRRNNRE